MRENMLDLRDAFARSSDGVLLRELHTEATDIESAETKKFTTCLECGEHIPVYSSYFCEKHLTEFLQGAEMPYIKTVDSFTISHSQL